MSKLDWRDEYDLHIKQIDEQHKRLFATIGKLSEAITEHRVEQELVGIFDEISVYTREHFATEEKYFKEFGYDGADGHMAAHAQFVKKTENLLKQMHEDSSFQISLELVAMLEVWWANHVLHMDKGYEKCFHDHGLK